MCRERTGIVARFPLRSSIAQAIFHEIVHKYAADYQQEKDRRSAFDERRKQAVLSAKWRRGNVKSLPPNHFPSGNGFRRFGPLDVPHIDWEFERMRVDGYSFSEAGLSAGTYGVGQFPNGSWEVGAWIPREWCGWNYKTTFREPLPLPAYGASIDSTLKVGEWFVLFAAVSELNPDEATLCPFARVSNYFPPDPPTIRKESNRLTKQRLPIDRLTSELESADTKTIERFQTGRGIVIEELRRECFNRLLEKVRSDGTSTLNLVASEGERPEFLPAWHSPHWPAMDTPQAFDQWLTCTRRALDHWMASFPSPSDCDDDVSRVLARQALEDADTLARHLRDRHGITDVPLRPTDDSLSAAKWFLHDVVQAISKPIDDDDSSYRPASELWPQRQSEFPYFKNYAQFGRYFKKIPESEIRRKHKGQPLWIHAGDWGAYWKRIKDERDQLHDSLPPELQRSLQNEAQARGTTAKR